MFLPTNSRQRSLREAVSPTTFIEAPRLSAYLGVEDLTIAAETFQKTGSFKFRAAYNLALQVKQDKLITASSGNFGQALAYACALLGKHCTVVMPDNSAKVKVDAVREFGGVVELVETRLKPRSQRVAELAREHPDAFVASAFDDPLVIEGNATLGAELALKNFDVVIAPIGGGGLTSGIISGLAAGGATTKVYGAEPLMANDAARSLRKRQIVKNEQEPQTIADGARTLSLGQHNWLILKEALAGVIEVSEPDIEEAVRLLFLRSNLKAEPTGALSVAALLRAGDQFRARRVCCVVSGGNVDPAIFQQIMAAN